MRRLSPKKIGKRTARKPSQSLQPWTGDPAHGPSGNERRKNACLANPCRHSCDHRLPAGLGPRQADSTFAPGWRHCGCPTSFPRAFLSNRRHLFVSWLHLFYCTLRGVIASLPLTRGGNALGDKGKLLIFHHLLTFGGSWRWAGIHRANHQLFFGDIAAMYQKILCSFTGEKNIPHRSRPVCTAFRQRIEYTTFFDRKAAGFPFGTIVIDAVFLRARHLAW